MTPSHVPRSQIEYGGFYRFTFEELLRAMMMEQDATRRVLVRKGLLTNDEILEEIKAVRREVEGKWR